MSSTLTLVSCRRPGMKLRAPTQARMQEERYGVVAQKLDEEAAAASAS